MLDTDAIRCEAIVRGSRAVKLAGNYENLTWYHGALKETLDEIDRLRELLMVATIANGKNLDYSGHDNGK